MSTKYIKNKRIFVCLGAFLILAGLFIIGYKKYEAYKKNINEQNLVKEFYEEITIESSEEVLEEKEQTTVEEQQEELIEEKENYVAVINIPKLHLERGIYAKYSKNNSVNKTVKMLYQSDMPDEENSNFILASHAGSSEVAYFKNLSKLDLGDRIYIIYKGKRYTYIVDKKIEVDKDGEIEISKINNKKILTLITCMIGQKKQLVVIANLESEEELC